jgi:hypothetical protein
MGTSLADFNPAIEMKPNQCDLHQNRATGLSGLGLVTRSPSRYLGAFKSGQPSLADSRTAELNPSKTWVVTVTASGIPGIHRE